jgi:hypothetical protein
LSSLKVGEFVGRAAAPAAAPAACMFRRRVWDAVCQTRPPLQHLDISTAPPNHEAKMSGPSACPSSARATKELPHKIRHDASHFAFDDEMIDLKSCIAPTFCVSESERKFLACAVLGSGKWAGELALQPHVVRRCVQSLDQGTEIVDIAGRVKAIGHVLGGRQVLAGPPRPGGCEQRRHDQRSHHKRVEQDGRREQKAPLVQDWVGTPH